MFKEDSNEFRFDWSHLGDIELGRPNMGPTTSVAIYRLMQFTLRDSAIKHTNPEIAARIFYDAGYNSGCALYKNMILPVSDFNELINKLQKKLSELNVGILRIEEANIDDLTFTLTVSEDLDCSGLPLHEEAICTFDEGLIAGILESYTGTRFNVKEIDCWCTGDRTCRFRASAINA